MPTPLRNIRIDEDLWQRAMGVAAERGESLSQVIRDALVEYVMRHAPQPKERRRSAAR